MAQENMSLEERTHLQDAATAFASYITRKYPQINEDGKLNYYISGSLAVLLLSQSESLELLNSSQLPTISTKEKKELNDGLVAKLTYFTRKIGDFDYVETTAYINAKKGIPSYSDDPKGHCEGRKKFLFKGGGGPSIDELPDLAKSIIAEAKPGYKVMCDPLSTYDEDKIARIKIKNKEYFISDPCQIFGYKVLHLMQSFGHKPDKFKKDFAILHKAFLHIYSEKELTESTYAILVEFENSMTEYGPQANKYIRDLEQNPNFDSTIIPFFKKIKEYDLKHKNIL